MTLYLIKMSVLLCSMFLRFTAMGRGKLSFNFLSNPKSRSSTFKKRKDSLLKKAYELSTLCDVPICLLIHGPAASHSADQSEFHTWPPNRTDIESMIRAYKNKSSHLKQKGLYDFFLDRKGKIDADISKIRDNVEQILCPKWDERLDCLSEHQLAEFMAGLDSKIEAATGMIDFMEAGHAHSFDQLEGPLTTAAKFSSEGDQSFVAMGEDPGMPPLVELDFPDFSVSPSPPNGEEFGYNFEVLQSLLEEDNDNYEFINLTKAEIDCYSNNLESLMMGAGTSRVKGCCCSKLHGSTLQPTAQQNSYGNMPMDF